MSVEPTPSRFTRRDLQSRAVSGAMWTLLHVVVSLPVAFVVNIVVARVLGVSDYGRLAYLTMVMDIATLVVMVGVGAGLIQFGSKAHALGDFNGVQAVLRRSQGFRLLVGAPLLTIVVVLLAEAPRALLVVAIVFGIWIPAAFGGATAALTIQNDTARAARLAMVVSVVVQGAVLTTVMVLPQPDAVWSVRLVATGLGVIAAILLVDPGYRRAVLTPRPPNGMPRGFWRYAIPVGISGIVAAIALNRSEVVLLEHLSTAEQVGLYAVAFGLAGHLFAPAQALLNPLTPAVSALREIDVEAIGDAFRRTARVSAMVGGLVIAAGGPPLAVALPLLYGDAYAEAQGLVLALTIVSGFLLLTFPMQAFVTARLRGGSTLAVNLLAAGTSVAVALLAIPVVGAWGAVLAKVFVVLVRIAWLAAKERESFMVSRTEFLGVFRATVVASVAAGSTYALVSMVDPGTVMATVVVALASALASLLAFLVLVRAVDGVLDAGDVAAIQRALPTRLHGVTAPLLSLVTAR